MKRIFRNIWDVVSYPLLYLGIQGVVSFFYMVVLGAVVGFQNATLIASVAMSPEEITALVMEKIDIQVPLLISLLLTLFIVFLLQHKKWKEEQFWKVGKFKPILIAILIVLGIGLNLFTSGIASLVEGFGLFPEHAEIIGITLSGNIWMQIACVGLLAPIVEEIIFRGILLGRMSKKMKPILAICLQALIFSIIHMNLLQGMYAFVLGVVLGLVVVRVKSIWAVIVVHFAHNSISIVITYLLSGKNLSIDFIIILSIVGLVTSVGFLSFITIKRNLAHAEVE